MPEQNPQAASELQLKLNHLRGSLTELLLRSGANLRRLKAVLGANAEVSPVVDDLLQYHQEWSSSFAELEILLDNLRRRREEAELQSRQELGQTRFLLEASKLDVRDLEQIASCFRQIHELILFSKAPSLPLEKLKNSQGLELQVSLDAQESHLVFHFKSPLLEDGFASALLEIARTLGMGEASGSQEAPLSLGWGTSMLAVLRKLQQRKPEPSESEREPLLSHLRDQLAPLAEPSSLGIPLPSLQQIAQLLGNLLLDLQERSQASWAELSGPRDTLVLLDVDGARKKAARPAPAAGRDVLREKVDRFIKIRNP